MKALVLWAVVIFVAGFFDGRQMEKVTETANAVSATPPRSAPEPSRSVATEPATSAANPTTPSSHVGIKLLKFSPENIEVKSGETVEWANADLTPHNVTSQGTPEINSGTINAGASWTHTFDRPGTFPYYCSFHPEMKGVVVVQ